MSGSGFFIDKTLTAETTSKFSTRSRFLIVAAISILYGVIALAIAAFFLNMSSHSLMGVTAVYIYGILGGLAILMLKRIFARAEQNRQILFDVLDRSPDAQAITDRDGNILYANQTWKNLYGEKDVLAYQDVADIFFRPHKLRQTLQAYFTKHDGTPPAQQDFSFVGRATDNTRWLKVIVHPITDWPDHNQWFVHDVTHEYQEQQVSEEQYQEMKSLFSHLPAGLCITNEDGIIIQINNKLNDFLNVIDKKVKFHDLFVTPPEDKSAPYSLFKDGRKIQSGHYKIKSDSGAEKHVFLLHCIVPQKNGAIRGYTVFYDPAEQTVARKQGNAEKLAEDIGGYFQELFTAAPLGMCTVTADLEITHCNSAFTHLSGRENCLNMALSSFVVKDQQSLLQQWIGQIAETDGRENAHALEIGFLQEKGQLPVCVYAHKITENELALCFVDLTQQKNLEQQFSQSQKMQAVGQLAGGIAHDFNNLLTAMIGFCDLLLLRHKPGDPSFADIMQIKQNANRASNLVRQLLAFSRQQTLQPKVLDLTDVLSDLSHLLQRLIGATIQMNIKHGQNLWSVKCDEGQLEQVLINLAVNARDAMSGGGTLDIITENYSNGKMESLGEDEFLPVGDWVLIKVRDTGTGIPPDVMRRIFEPFFSTKEIGSGTGLGLSTVHGIVHQTGGYLSVDSVVNEGTTFTIYLPRHQIQDKGDSAEKAEAEKPVKDEASEDLTGSAAILLVEDEDAVRTFSSRALSNKGYKIVDAPHGEAALELLENMKIDIELLVTDVIMPEMDGPTLAKHLRRLYPKLKIIFMSGYSEDRFKEEFGKNTHFLQKPFTLQQLAKKVKDVLEE
ncbi:MAG: response regulator [Pseudomonadota bacterium]|nr:response regulator [Pseudomonadota bacterium]QKK05326.1 MAG: response regulator [Pseudomonadota bacterium]